MASLIVRFMEKVRIQPGACWIWTGAKAQRGREYGSFRHPETKYAHRAAYLMFVGPIPDGLEVDHTCHNAACVNPDHLEPVTPEVNTRRALGTAIRTGIGTCTAAHPDVAPRLKRSKSGRLICLECRLVDEKKRRARRSAALAA